jgi:predicted Rossmann fold flavoprotein
VYPLSKQASSVLDFMRAYLDSVGAQIKTDFFATKISKKEELFTVVSEDGQTVKAKNVIFAVGGNCQKQFGTDGSGYKVLTALGHTVTKLYPSLVQLKTETEKIKSLKGLKADAVITAYNNDVPVATATGEVLFTDYGISGNAVFKISGYVSDENNNKVVIQFIPEMSEDELKQTIVNRKKNQPYLPTDELLTGLVNKMVGKAIIKNSLSASARDIASSAKNFTLTVKGTTGFNYAQVTKGGISALEVSNKTMESEIVKNLYIVGEVLDVDGDCGGYNLQWAFSSAQVAVRSILYRLGAK